MGSLTVTKVAVGWDVLITGEAVHVRDTGHLGNLHFCTIFGEPTSALKNEVFFFNENYMFYEDYTLLKTVSGLPLFGR